MELSFLMLPPKPFGFTSSVGLVDPIEVEESVKKRAPTVVALGDLLGMKSYTIFHGDA